MRSSLIAVALILLIAGCQPVEEGLPTRPRPLSQQAYTPTTSVRTVVLAGEMTAIGGHDGVPVVRVDCFLFPSLHPGDIAVVGKGSFRFEIYDARQPVADRVPLDQINYNYEQSLRHGTTIWGMPAYRFSLPLRGLSASVSEVFVRGRFFPEGMRADDPDAEPVPGGIRVHVSSTASPVVRPPASPSTASPSAPESAPDIGRPFRIRLRTADSQPDAAGGS